MIVRRPSTLAPVAAAGLLVLVLAGCTGSPEPEPTPTASEQAPGVTDIEDAPGSGEGLVGALEDAEVEACEAADGGWAVNGTVTNSTDAEADYRIYVSLLNGAGDTRGLTQVDVDDVAAGDTQQWDTSVELEDDDLSCVLRVERYEG